MFFWFWYWHWHWWKMMMHGGHYSLLPLLLLLLPLIIHHLQRLIRLLSRWEKGGPMLLLLQLLRRT